MKLVKRFLVLILGGTCITYAAIIINDTGEVPYPTGYREWNHVKSGIIGPKSPSAPKYEGFAHTYANDKALEGYKTGIFPEGSMMVVDVLESEIINEGVKEGKRKFIDVMYKDSNRYDSTGGWGFEQFTEGSINARSILQMSKSKCFNCHSSQKDRGFVFGSGKLRN